MTSLALHSLIIRGDGRFSGFLRTSAECYRMRMDSFRDVLPAISSFLAQTLKVSPFRKSPFCQILRSISPPESRHLMRGNCTIDDTPLHPPPPQHTLPQCRLWTNPGKATFMRSLLEMRDVCACTQTDARADARL